MYKLARVIPDPISGIVTSVDCLGNITDQFAMVCDFCFSLIQRPSWVKNSHHHLSENHVYQTLCTYQELEGEGGVKSEV